MARSLKLAGLVALVTAATLSTDHAQVLMQRDVSLHMALTIAETTIAECEKTGNDASVAVVDRAGRLRVFLQGDKAAPHNIELAQRKAPIRRAPSAAPLPSGRSEPVRIQNLRGSANSNT